MTLRSVSKTAARAAGKRGCIRSAGIVSIRALFVFVIAVMPGARFARGAAPEGRTYGSQALAQLNDSLRDLSEAITPSVVQITGTGYSLADRKQQSGISVLSRERSIGSGVIVSDDGYIITNAHVVEGSRSIRVKVNGTKATGKNSFFDARLIGSDSVLDLALLKIPATGLKPISFFATDVRQGQVVLAAGNPLGMENSVSLGVVSSSSRQLSEDDPRVFIQTDAPINPGNSGGPLVDIDGRLVGINTFIISESGGSEGVGFAIPSDVVRYAYDSLRKDGRVRRGEIGIFARTITVPFAVALKLEPETGILVEDVIPGGPADQAGVHISDVILSFAGTPLHNVRDLATQLYNHPIGATVDLQIFRDGKPMQIAVPIVEKENNKLGFADLVNPDRDLISKLQILGLTVDDEIRRILGLRQPAGVVVAAFVGPVPYFGDHLREGDVIHAVNGRRVTTVEMLRDELDKIEQGQPIILQAERDGVFNFLALEPN